MVARRSIWAAVVMGWAFLALLLAALELPGRAEDLGPPLAVMTTVGVAGAVGSSIALALGRRYLTGMGLILSAFIPTGFTVLNTAVLIIGFVVAVRATRRRLVLAT